MLAKKDHHRPCLNCMLSPLLYFGRFCGFLPLRFKCNSKERPCEFSINWIWAMLSIVNCTVIIFMIVLSIREFVYSHSQDMDPSDLIEQVVITIDITNQIASILLILINLMQARLRSKALNKIALIIYTKRFGINRIISGDHSKKIFYSGLWYVALVIVLVLFQVLFTVYFVLNEHIEKFWMYVVKTIYFSLSNTIYIITGMEFNMLTAVIKYMIYEIFNELKSVLSKSRSYSIQIKEPPAERKFWDSNKIKFIPSIRVQTHSMAEVSMSGDVTKTVSLGSSKSPEFSDQIGSVRLSYCSIYMSLKMLNHFMNPQLIVMTMLVMFSVVLNSYLIIQFLVMQRIRMLFIVTIIRLFVVVGIYIYMILQAEDLYRTGDLIFQHVVSIKTSQYSLHEMTQLEMLIKQIHGNPPQFTALDIFKINAGILDTMFGSVITYILVALQFRMSDV